LPAFLLCLGAAQGQFAAFDWTTFGDPSVPPTVDATSMHVVGPDDPGGCTGDGTAGMQSVAPTSGWVIADYVFDNQDTGFGWWAVEDPMYVVDGVVTYVGPGDIFDTWEGTVAFPVAAGQSFGFGVISLDCLSGPGVLDVTDFEFLPDTWTSLGGALTGSAGDPLLNGLGPLVADTPWTLSLVDANPSSAAWLIVSPAVLGAPFKGGVMVPDPGASAVFVLLATSPLGRIVFGGDWPSGIPAGVPLVMQYWIADPAGPAGWAASNGVTRTTH
jgi:hypothetical protein